MPISKHLPAVNKAFECALYFLVFSVAFAKSFTEIAITAIILFWLIKRGIENNRSLPKLPLMTPWLIFLFFCLISIAQAEFLYISVRALFSKYLPYFLVFIAVSEFGLTERMLKNIVTLATIVISLILLDGAYQYISGADILGHKTQFVFITTRDVKRISATFGHPNNYGTFLIAILPLLFSLTLANLRRLKHSLLFGTLFMGSLLSLYLTQSRGAIAAMIAAWLSILILWKKKWATLLLAVITLFILFSPLPLAENIRNSFNFESSSSGSITDRLRLWTSTIDMIKEKPLLGWGLNNYSRIHYRFAGTMDSWYTHNCYLQMASEIGIPGLLAFLTLLFFIFIYFYRQFRRSHGSLKALYFGFLVSFLSMSFHAMVDTNLYSLLLTTLYWLIITLGFQLNSLSGQGADLK